MSDAATQDMPSRLCLITDDSALVRKIARKTLTQMGFEIDEAEDGRIALNKCRSRMPDAILLDWNMPIMDGLEFLVALRRSEGGMLPSVIFCTTETDVSHVHRAIEAGADAYLMKPFDSESMGAAFAQLTFRQNPNFPVKQTPVLTDV